MEDSFKEFFGQTYAIALLCPKIVRINLQKLSTKDILKIFGVGTIVFASVAIPNLPIAVGAALKIWKNINKHEVGRVIKRLQKQNMISIKDNGQTITIQITDRGKKRLLEYDFENITLKAKRRDGKWRLVIFDIPEDKKHARDMFRKKLLQMGLVRLQDSVFASVFPCKKEIDFLCHFLNISDYITLVSLDKIERGEKLIFKPYYDF